nr:MAG TPA: minor capsid protein 2 [Caudoviricetes sp.]
MQITEKAWTEYITKMSQISQKAAGLMQTWVQKNGFENDKALLDYAYALSQHYGQAIGALACQMYEATAAAQGVIVPPAEIADLPEYGEVAKAINGTKKQSELKVPSTLARLVKQVGADTTLKNAQRDGAQFAWVPHGDTCAFCLTLASRGWQYMSKKALKNGHAEHIHAHCDCEYAVRFDRKSTVAGYDPEKYLEEYNNAGGDVNAMRRMRYGQNKDAINARKRELYEEQAYRKVKRGSSKEVILTRNKTKITIQTKKVESYNTPIYISDNAKIKPKALNTINQNTEKALKEYGVLLKRKPTVIILAEDELNDALGLYDPCTNTVYYSQILEKPEAQKLAGGKGAVEWHEMWHMKQAENFREAGWNITRENRGEYLKELCKNAKNNIDNYGVTYDNVGEISEYAKKQFMRGRYDEVEAEYMSIKKRS